MLLSNIYKNVSELLLHYWQLRLNLIAGFSMRPFAGGFVDSAEIAPAAFCLQSGRSPREL